MIRIFIMLAISVGNVAFAGRCSGDLLANLELNNRTVRTVCVENKRAAEAALTCPRGKNAEILRSYRNGNQRMVDVSCVQNALAIAPYASTNASSARRAPYGPRGYNPRTNYERGSDYYRSVPRARNPLPESRVPMRARGKNPSYREVVDATYAWRLMNDRVQEANVEVSTNTGAVDRAMSAESALARERAAFKKLEAEYYEYMKAHPNVEKEVK